MKLVVAITTLLVSCAFGCAHSDQAGPGATTRCAEPEAASGAPTASAAALDPATKRDDIRAVLELTGAAALAQQVIDPILTQFQQLSPDVPTEVWDRIRKKFANDDLIDMVVDIYDQELSHEDIVAMRRFYESENGRRITAALPTITAKAQTAGREWGERIAREVIDELIAEGYAGQ